MGFFHYHRPPALPLQGEQEAEIILPKFWAEDGDRLTVFFVVTVFRGLDGLTGLDWKNGFSRIGPNASGRFFMYFPKEEKLIDIGFIRRFF